MAVLSVRRKRARERHFRMLKRKSCYTIPQIAEDLANAWADARLHSGEIALTSEDNAAM